MEYIVSYFSYMELFCREISFQDIEEEDIITRAWELSKRILIYCLYVTLPVVEFHVYIVQTIYFSGSLKLLQGPWDW